LLYGILIHNILLLVIQLCGILLNCAEYYSSGVILINGVLQNFIRLNVVAPLIQNFKFFHQCGQMIIVSNKKTDPGVVINSLAKLLQQKYVFQLDLFRAIGFYNEADTLEFSSILIYSTSEQSIYTQNGWHKAALIKHKLKGGN
jgi:hypothetical protein